MGSTKRGRSLSHPGRVTVSCGGGEREGGKERGREGGGRE